MKILAIDTATEACSAALHIDGETTSRYEFAPQKHAELILAMVDELLSEAGLAINNLDALSFGRGPGSFTGVRIAGGVVQGLAFAADLPVVPVSTLAALAQGEIDKSTHIFSAIDARMGEIYWCLFKVSKNQVVPITDESINMPEQIRITTGDKWFGAGSGWSSYADILKKNFSGNLSGYDGDVYPDAANIIPLAIPLYDSGQALQAEDVLPVYLRNKVTQ